MNQLPLNISKIIIDQYSKSFKKSDNDFGIYINPNVPNGEQILNDIVKLNYEVLQKIRFYLSNNPYIIDIFKHNKQYVEYLLLDKIKLINAPIATIAKPIPVPIKTP